MYPLDRKAVGHGTLKSTGLTYIYLFINLIMNYYWPITRPDEVSKTAKISVKEVYIPKEGERIRVFIYTVDPAVLRSWKSA